MVKRSFCGVRGPPPAYASRSRRTGLQRGEQGVERHAIHGLDQMMIESSFVRETAICFVTPAGQRDQKDTVELG